MQGVQIAQNAVDLATDNFNASIKKQREPAKAMFEVEKRLKSLQENGRTLDEIKVVLRDCIAVLVDLVVQIGKLEKFFTMLTTVTDEIVLPTAKLLQRDMGRTEERAARDKFISVDDAMKQTIYVATLQLRAYFSLLEDIAGMYCKVNQQYIMPGMDLCTKISVGSAGRTPIAELTAQLSTYSEDASRQVTDLVNNAQSEMLASLRSRARKAAKTSQMVGNTERHSGGTVDSSAQKEIEKGREDAATTAATMIEGQKSAAVLRDEEIVLD